MAATVTANTGQQMNEMTESEFKAELATSLIILTTSSPDKRDIYRLLFSSLAKDEQHLAGINAYFTDSGALGIAPRKTAEQTGLYADNLLEKTYQQMKQLSTPDTQTAIRYKLAEGNNEFNAREINIIGMTEDSGWEIKFAESTQEQAFVEKVIELITPRLRKADTEWLIGKLRDTSFPGPNLKPLQERLEGGFNELVELIYDAAEQLNIKELRYSSTVNVNFVSPKSGKYFPITKTCEGRMLTREEFYARLVQTSAGSAVNSNFIHIPDGQASGQEKTLDVLISEGLHTKSSSELPASYARREITEYIQTIIGKRRSSATERSRPVCVAFADPADAKNPVNMPHINDLNIVSVPTDAELLETPNLRSFGKADVIVLRPSDVKRETNQLTSDPNLGLLLKFVVTAETDPESMSIPIILDNRTGKFNSALEIISNAFVQGRLMGDLPFHIANTDEELEHHLRVAKDVKQRAPRIDTSMASAVIKKQPLPARVPHDGVFTVFIGGGHANNSKRDMEDATTFGYYCASQGWRIVTGAGSVEGSMGAIHTGFIQHHLDRLQESDSLGAFKATLDQQFKIEGSGKYDAEKLILINPNLVEQMAEQNLIPRNMFFGYSMKPLLEMESPSGQEPPGITYFDAGNRARRLQGLLAPGTKIFLPGSIGTDEEFEETVKQHLEAKKQKLDSGRSNDIAFSDGTPDDDGKMIIFNRNGHLDKLLAHYKLFGDDAVTKANRRIHNVEVVTSLEDLKKATESRGNSWLERARSSKDTGAPAQAA